MTPDKAQKMLKDGNTRFPRGKTLKRDLREKVKATAVAGSLLPPL